MARFSVWLINQLNDLIPLANNIHNLYQAKLSEDRYQEWEEKEAERLEPEFGPMWDIKDLRVLDIGCGLGGKLIHYSKLGPRSIDAIDIRKFSVRKTLELAQKEGCSQIRPVASDSANLPYKDESFDVIISVNVFEHVDDLYRTLAECKRVIHPGGLIFLHFPPFYSPWGAHLEGWINFPWPHVFFSDKMLITAACQIEEKRKLNDSFISTAQVKWSQLDRLPELNRATVGSFFKMVNDLRLDIIHADMLPFGRHYLQNKGKLAGVTLSILRHLATWPILREVVTTKMVVILSKGR